MEIQVSESKGWPRWQLALRESRMGYPPPYPTLPTSSGNLIHHGYSLAQLCKTFPTEIKQLKTVVEFGGGYGSFARLLYQLGFNGLYVIFDLPVFLYLQEFFLAGLEKQLAIAFEPALAEERKVVLLSDAKGLRKQAELSKCFDLFVALWSLSESPLKARAKIEKTIFDSNSALIAYQERFGSIDNRNYFETLRINNPQFIWRRIPINHLPRNHYLIGKRKK